MRVLIIGDTHCDKRFANEVCAAAEAADVEVMIQLGDWDLRLDPYFRQVWVDWLEDGENRHFYWLDGNHDQHDYIQRYIMEPNQNDADHPLAHWHERMWYCPRGSVTKIGDTTVMFVGGAASIDKDRRTPGWDWFPGEDLNDGQVMHAIDNGMGVDVICSHDCPNTVWFGGKLEKGDYKVDPASEANRHRMTQIVDAVSPWRVYHGHYHVSYQTLHKTNKGQTMVQGLGANIIHTAKGTKPVPPVFGDNIELVNW